MRRSTRSTATRRCIVRIAMVRIAIVSKEEHEVDGDAQVREECMCIVRA